MLCDAVRSRRSPSHVVRGAAYPTFTACVTLRQSIEQQVVIPGCPSPVSARKGGEAAGRRGVAWRCGVVGLRSHHESWGCRTERVGNNTCQGTGREGEGGSDEE